MQEVPSEHQETLYCEEQHCAVHVDGESRLAAPCSACREGQRLVIPSEPEKLGQYIELSHIF
ncbi:hypothetical protein QYF61_020803 [Mycteria americana]|uniref:Uncharacterized protein n=1 Tax=Mycteria americana TaxID=33587 RepID=A0AAN7SJ22_MYCAM|nr:hypothetical protein QYF61_020803 [Mycteria americana]